MKPPPPAFMELIVKIRLKRSLQGRASSLLLVPSLRFWMGYLSLVPFYFLICETGKMLLNLISWF